MAWFARLTRGAMLETLAQDYVLAARGKGLPHRQVVLRHVFRNALFPLVTVAGPMLAVLITGTFDTDKGAIPHESAPLVQTDQIPRQRSQAGSVL
jgi:ABC-type dipeptide/oligopeptide/nickel transport system permease component